MIKHIDSGDLLSQVTVSNGTAYLSGQVAFDSRGADFPTQAAEVFGRIDALLEKAGTDRSRLLTATVWLADLGHFAGFNELWRHWLGVHGRPARATVKADLVLPGLLIEIQVTAAVGD
ncbi:MULTISPECIES: RidA family protein [Bradyrhizobium]|uniref:RidA family protein n=1 Tax=Bradyrhizobium brasilense TaxID=1419277 RepID=A0ABY8JJI9_9BRAD|nr:MULTISPECIES: RidA family protein [Bradyrhizobium]MCP1848880.1 enamine deaminase RidA (YjgF/YER057c/UK114 family) [Bradyrhizobium sp. USDA 4541]WFU65354.1 RidA family protein [Bradyrhizobium brasilense]